MGRARLAGVLVAAVVAAVMGGGRAASAGPRSGAATPAQAGLAVYEWRGLSQLARPSTRQRLRFLHGQGFTTVYVDLGEYLDAADQPKTPEQQALLRRLGGNLAYVVAEASHLGLTVHAGGAGPTSSSSSVSTPPPPPPRRGSTASSTTSSRTSTRASSTTRSPRSSPTSRRSRTSWRRTGRYAPDPAITPCGSASPSRSGSTGKPAPPARCPSTARPSPPPSISSTSLRTSPTPTSW